MSVMCKAFGVSRSGYYDFVRRLGRPDADAGSVDSGAAKALPADLRLPADVDMVEETGNPS